MTRTRETHRLVCEGDTRPAKESLKARGWKWDQAAGHWWMGLVDAHAARVPSDEAFFRGLGGHKKGCRLVLDGVEVWRSKTYGQTQAQPTTPPARMPDADGMGWNCDAAGNYAAGARIPGSDPNDRI